MWLQKFFIFICLASSVLGEDIQCPEVDGPDPTYFPHETDCGKFYECSNGQAYLIDCPDGLDFNPELNVCDYPEQVGCTGKTSGAEISSSTAITSTDPTVYLTTFQVDTTEGTNQPQSTGPPRPPTIPQTPTPTLPPRPTPPPPSTTTNWELTTTDSSSISGEESNDSQSGSSESSESDSRSDDEDSNESRDWNSNDSGQSSDDFSNSSSDSKSTDNSSNKSDEWSSDTDKSRNKSDRSNENSSGSRHGSDESNKSHSRGKDVDSSSKYDKNSNGSKNRSTSGNKKSETGHSREWRKLGRNKIISGKRDALQGEKCVVDPVKGTLKRHPHECVKYLHCYKGGTIVKSCAKQYKFDDEIHICVPPPYAKCTNA